MATSRKRLFPTKRGRCAKGSILRDGYDRKSYVKRDGTRVKASRVPASCIKDRGNPGKGHGPIPALRKGYLRKYGYDSKESVQKRHEALKRAVKNYGGLSVFRKLNAVFVLTKNTSPNTSSKFKADRDWVRKNYMNSRKSPRKSRRSRRGSPRRRSPRRRSPRKSRRSPRRRSPRKSRRSPRRRSRK